MKRLISLIGVIAILLTMSVSVFAGSVPEDLLQEDTAKVFLGTVENYTTKDIPSAPYTEIDSVEVIPTEKIKGDVEIGVKQTYSKDKLYCSNDWANFVKNREINIDQTVRLIQIPMVIWTEPR